MSLVYLLDTNIISEPLRPSPNPHVLHCLQTYQNQIAIATVVWHELLFGCHRLPPCAKREAIEGYLHEVIAPAVPILPYDDQAAHWHAVERARLSAQGTPPPFADGQIAAVAYAHQLVLVTANIADYTPFAGLELVNWFTAG